MTDDSERIADRFRRLATGFTARVQAVPEDRWESPSPCAGWTARDVVTHIVEAAGSYFPLIGRPLPAGPTTAEDPKAAWSTVRDAVQAGLDDPEIARTEYDGFMGRTSFEGGIDALLCFDLLVHAWDLARAAGLDERLDPDEVHRAFAQAEPMDQMLRSPGVCGPKLEPPAGADEQTRLLAFLGRAV